MALSSSQYVGSYRRVRRFDVAPLLVRHDSEEGDPIR